MGRAGAGLMPAGLWMLNKKSFGLKFGRLYHPWIIFMFEAAFNPLDPPLEQWGRRYMFSLDGFYFLAMVELSI